MHEFFIDEIEEIEDLGVVEDDFYDVGMEDSPHTFFANNILVHNSTYFSAIPIIEQKYTKYLTESEDKLIEKTLEISKEVETLINDKYTDYVQQYHGITDHKFKIKQELVGKTGFWVGKKRYAQWIKNKEGVPKDYIDYKGLDVVRSDFPPIFVDFMTTVVESIMDNKGKTVLDKIILEFMTTVESLDVNKISSSSSVNNVEKYSDKSSSGYTVAIKGSPSHVKGAINYNSLIEYYGYNKHYQKIKSKDKINKIYLKENSFGFDVISYPKDNIPPKIQEFISTFANRDEMFNSLVHNKLISFYEAMGWGNIPSKNENNINKFF